MAEDIQPLPRDVTSDPPHCGPGDDPAAEVAVAGGAQQELDQLLGQLVERIRCVQGTESRLRRLLRANLEVARGFDLDEVLGRIVTEAKDLVGAGYAALGIVDEGQLTRFLPAGTDPALVAGVGAGSVGFPPHPAPTRSFLGVPVRVRDQVFGHLYLSDKQGGGEFTREDEDLVCALAAAAGVAIENVTLLAASRRGRDWHAAMVNVTTELLSGTDPGQALRYLVRQVCQASGADGAGFTTTTDDPAWLRTVVAVDLLAQWEGVAVPASGSLSGSVIAERRTILVPDAVSDPRTAARARREPRVGAVMAAPVVGERGVRGVLLACRGKGNGLFASGELDMITTFAAQAALALELAELRRDKERLRVLEDRQRIACDLRNTVIRDVFSVGLSLQSIAARATSPDLRRAIGVKVDELDRIIRAVREAIFALDPSQPIGRRADRPA